MDIRRLWYALLHKAWLIILLAFLGGSLAGWYVKSSYVPMYEANSTLFVMNSDKAEMTGQSLDTNDINFSRELIITYSSIINSRLVTSEAASRLDIPRLSEDSLSGVVAAGNQKDSSMLSISAVWTDPQTAALICNTVSEVFAEKVNELTNSNSVGIIDKALVPQYPMPTNSRQKIAIGILMGLMLGFGIVYCMVQFDNTIREAGDVEDGLGLRVIGIIPKHSIK